MPKLKEIAKVVQKLSREQDSAAGGGASGSAWTGTKNIKSPPVYRGDLITFIIKCEMELP